ncbi:MAG: hypothetical protein CL489_12625 [Acidobacteria bacterium]|nr:hypothetical protein [Acidobacteriota bacterium]MBF85294.1 hypothetical protein [Acidobacteriota bacterium]
MIFAQRCVSVAWLVVVAMSMPSRAIAQEVIFIVRHAERVDGSSDAALSAEGEARARTLARHLRDAGVDAIYSTTYRRTLGTAAPLAEVLGLEVRTEPTHDIGTMMNSDPAVGRYVEGLIAQLEDHHGADRVLIVGHANTVPALLTALGHPKSISIGASEYNNLFVVMPGEEGPPTVLRIRF